MIVLAAVDPGTVTGFAWCSLNDDGKDFIVLPTLEQYSAYDFQGHVHRLAAEYGESLHLIIERFTISERTLRATKDGVHDALDTIGVTRYVSRMYCARIPEWQQPDQVMALFTDERLRQLGWYVRGLPHANDAARHLAWKLARDHVIRVPTG